MTYYESAENLTISKNRAFEEIKNHLVLDEQTKQDFFKECGDNETYKTTDVLIFLGY